MQAVRKAEHLIPDPRLLMATLLICPVNEGKLRSERLVRVPFGATSAAYPAPLEIIIQYPPMIHAHQRY